MARSAALPIFLPRAWPRVSWPGPCRQSTTPAAKFSEINTFTSQTECQSRRIYAAVAQRKGRRLITSRLPGSILLPGGARVQIPPAAPAPQILPRRLSDRPAKAAGPGTGNAWVSFEDLSPA